MTASEMVAQGGLLKTPKIAQQALADMLGVPITVMSTAGSGGPWGMAVLALYAVSGSKEKLPDWLDSEQKLEPEPAGREGAAKWLKAYEAALPLEQTAGKYVAE